MLVVQIDLGDVAALFEVEEVQLVAVLPGEQGLGDDPVLDQARRRPLSGDEDAGVYVPPEVVGIELAAVVELH